MNDIIDTMVMSHAQISLRRVIIYVNKFARDGVKGEMSYRRRHLSLARLINDNGSALFELCLLSCIC